MHSQISFMLLVFPSYVFCFPFLYFFYFIFIYRKKYNFKLLLLFPAIVTAYIFYVYLCILFLYFFGPAGLILNRNIRKSTRLKKKNEIWRIFSILVHKTRNPKQNDKIKIKQYEKIKIIEFFAKKNFRKWFYSM